MNPDDSKTTTSRPRKIPLERQPRPERVPLSYAQQRLWFLNKLRGPSSEYNLPFGLKLTGELDRVALERALNTIVARHESLRTRFTEMDGEPVQVIEPEAIVPLPVEDWSGLEEPERWHRVTEALRQEGAEPFDLTHAPLLRARLLKLNETEHVLLQTMHHIASDGWSEGVFNHELGELYEAYRKGLDDPLKPLEVQYADFTLWERRRLESGELDKGLAYWRSQLEDMPERVELPADSRRTKTTTFETTVLETPVSPALTTALKQLSQSNQATLYMTLLAAFGVLLSRYTGQDDVVVGSPIANRQHPQLQGMIGFFVNILLTRMRVTPGLSFRHLLDEVKQATWDGYEHQNVPFDWLVEKLAPHRNLDETPLFQVMFVLQSALLVGPLERSLKVETLIGDAAQARFDLEIHAFQVQGGLNLRWIYNRDLYEPWRIEQMARHYVAVLEKVVANPALPVRDFNLLGEQDEHQILKKFNKPQEPQTASTLTELFQRQVEKTPDAIAVGFGNHCLSYAELDHRSSRLGQALRALGVGPEDIVGIALPRSPELVASMLAVWKAGAAYLPLDLNYPAERIQLMAADSAAKVIICGPEAAPLLAGLDPAPATLDPVTADYGDTAVAALDRTHPRNTAYIIYTSGSTGRPKGVAIEHRSVVTFLRWAESVFSPADREELFASTSVCFDLSVFELFLPLCCGGKVVLAPQNALDLYEVARTSQPTLINTVPSAMAELLRSGRLPESLRVVNLGGELLTPQLVAAVSAGSRARVLDLYGPSETTIYSTYAQRQADGPQVIGRPIANTRAYVLDTSMQPVPVGVTGELYLGGAGLARGYVGRARATAERFVADPWGEAGARMYRTGDLVRWRPDGTLELHGRVDHQVKVRGFRIELGEIETALRSHPQVQDTVVILRDDDEDKRLVGYVTRVETVAERDEAREKLIEQWGEVWEQIYRPGEEQSAETFGPLNLVGWMDSYTGQPIAPEEMKIWVGETVARLKELNAKRVLEIGCGTGLLLTRLAPGCSSYVGVDFSSAVLDQLGAYVSTQPDLKHVELRRGFAHDLSFIADKSVDLVILNSVVQYFPDVQYLINTLNEALRVTRSGGHIFFGDVRSLPLAEAYHASVQVARSDSEMTVNEVRRRVTQAMHDEEELLIDARFFEEIGRRHARAGRVKSMLKAGSYDNELSRFRYDVLVGVGEAQEAAEPDRWLTWDADQSWKTELEKFLLEDRAAAITVRHIPDRRVANALSTARLLAKAPADARIGELQNAICDTPAEDPDEVMRFARSLGVEIVWRNFGNEGVYDAIFNPHWRSTERLDDLPATRYARFTNTPVKNTTGAEFVQELKLYLGRMLPDHMVPPSIVVMKSLPLTPNGKLDRRRLPLPESAVNPKTYSAPRTPEEEVLCEIFAQVLGVERVGVKDSFFEIGGHSLMATRLTSRIRALLGAEIPVRTVFEAPTAAQLVKRLRDERSARPPLQPQSRPDHLPLSYAQQRLWFVDRLEKGSPEYNVPHALRLRGELDEKALQRALNAIVERHESLRTHFEEVDGQPVQIIEPPVTVPLTTADLTGLTEVDQLRHVTEIVKHEWNEPFDLSRAPLLRLRLIKFADRDHVLVRTVHHVAWDGWSEEIFNRELGQFYDAYRNGLSDTIKPLELQYADFTIWQRQWLESGALDEGLRYWRSQLEGVSERVELPADRPRQVRQSFKSELFQVSLSSEQLAAIRRVSTENQTTPYMTLLAAFAALLARYTEQEDIVIGSPIANRQDAHLEELIGFFVNMLIMRVGVTSGLSLRQLLLEVKDTTLAAYQHQDVPFERLVQELAPLRGPGPTPFLHIVFALQNAPSVPVQLSGLQVENVGTTGPRVPVDLALNAVADDAGGLSLYWLYNGELFDQWRIEQLAQHYVRILQAMSEDIDQRLGSVQMLAPAERTSVLANSHGPRCDVPSGGVVELFEQQVELRPCAVAAMCEASHLTYAELNERANRLACLLIEKGVGQEDLVAVSMPRSLEFVIALVAIMKAGAAYLPIDPDGPQQRVSLIFEDSSPACVLTIAQLAASLPECPAIVLDDPKVIESLEQHAGIVPQAKRSTKSGSIERAAYVVYTSGSTGRPKGVVIPQRALFNKIYTLSRFLNLSTGTRYAALSPISFDPISEEIWNPLCTGGTAVIFPQDFRDHLDTFSDNVNEWCPTVLPMSVALAEHWVSHNRIRPEALIMGGDVIEATLANKFLQSGRAAERILNAYGPTESCIDASWYELRQEQLTPTVPIGTPAPNYRLYVLDKGLEPAPVGVPGEIYIAGPGIARGYRNRPSLTAERFVADPYGDAGARMFRTGDLARWGRDGNLEFLGRADNQVKIRGYRVELGEIEAALVRQKAIAQAAVMVQDGEARRDRRLVGYVVPSAGRDVDHRQLKRELADNLPAYMVPAVIVLMESLPLAPNGKVDRKALPIPEFISDEDYRAPETPEEETLCALMAEVLRVDRVGIDDNFFDLGGHSLLATQLVSRIRSTFDVELSIKSLLEAPTPHRIAQSLTGSIARRPQLKRQERPERVPLSYAQQRLWFLNQLEGLSAEYNMPVGLKLTGELDRVALERALNTIVARHESLRTRFTEMDGEPVQVIEPEAFVPLPLEDWSGLEEPERWRRVTEALRHESTWPFDLTRAPQLRARLLKLGENEHVLLQTMHHIASDGWSEGVFNHELGELYEAYRKGLDDPLQPLEVQYADFTLWQRRWFDSDALDDGLRYWRSQLEGIPEYLELPTDRPRPEKQTFNAEAFETSLSPELSTDLKTLGSENQATLYMTLLAAFAVLLNRYSRQDDVVIGSPIANRQDARLEDLIGFFVNTLVMRVRVRPSMSFRELLAGVRRTALEAYQHQDVPFEKLVEDLSPKRSLDRTPLYQVMFALQNAPWSPEILAGLHTEPVRGTEVRVRTDLELHAGEESGRIKFLWVFDHDLFDRWRIEQMARDYERVLESIVADVDGKLGGMDIGNEQQELEMMIEVWNDAETTIPQVN